MAQKKVVTAALAAATLGAGLLAIPATAGAATPRQHFLAVNAAGRITPADSQLSSIAGYGIGMGSITTAADWKASMTFTVPTVKCLPNTTDPIFIELFFDGKDKKGNELFNGGDVIISCDNGVASYITNVSSDGGTNGGVNGSASPGDKITVDAKANRAGETTTLTNVTTGQVTSQTGLGFASADGAQASLQAGFGEDRFPRFSRVNFSLVRVAGQPLGSFGPGPIDATASDGTLKVQAGPFGSNGTSFVDTFVSDY